MFRKLFLIGVAAIGGIYLTSEEGKQARTALMKKKATFEPIVKDLLKQVNEILEGTKEINSDEIRANVNLLVKEAKQTIVEIDFEKTIDMVRDAIRVASKKIREAENELNNEKDRQLSPSYVKPVVAKVAPKKVKAPSSVSSKKPAAKVATKKVKK